MSSRDKHAMRPFDEGFEQVELAGRQVLVLAAVALQAASIDVEDPSFEHIALPGGAAGGSSGADRRRTARTRANQFAQFERLGEVVVGAQLQPDDPVDGIAFARQHDDRNVPVLADLARQVETVFLAEVEVQRDQARRYRAPGGTQSCAVLGLGNGETLPFEAAPQQGPNLGIVIDDKNVRPGS